MNDQKFLDAGLMQIVMIGVRLPNGRLEVGGKTYDEWPKNLEAFGKQFQLSDSDDEDEPRSLAWYDLLSSD